MNNLELKFDTAQTAIYLTIIQLGGLRTKCLSDYEDELLNNYLLMKHEPFFDNPYRPTVKDWVNPMNTSLFTQKVSKINKKIKDLLGEKLATPFLIVNEKGKYKVNLNQRFISIEGN